MEIKPDLIIDARKEKEDEGLIEEMFIDDNIFKEDDDNDKIFIEILKLLDKFDNKVIGEIVEVSNDSMVVRGSNGLIFIKDIAIEGKKRCKVKDYFNGI